MLLILNLPVNRLHTMFFQEFIRLTEMLASKETAVRRQWTGMGCFQNQMLRIVQHRSLHLRRSSPEHKYHRSVLLIEHTDSRIGEFFPADASVGIGLMSTDSQYRVQKHKRLLLPIFPDNRYWEYSSRSHRAAPYKY